MNMISREAHFHRGPRFFRNEAGADMFEHRIDASACIGPRLATKLDKQNNPELWAAHLAEWTEQEDRKLKRGPGRPRKEAE
jgi:hypothetical protein